MPHCFIINDIFSKISESTTRSCLYNSAAFQHFQYSLDLMRDCESRVELVIPMDKETKLPTNVMVQINIIGEVTENDLKLLSKRKGNNILYRLINSIPPRT